MKKILLFLVLYSNLYFSQIRNKEIDSLINLADQNINVDFDKTLFFAKKALVKARQENDTERIAKASYYAARSLVFFRRFEEGAPYIDEGLKTSAVNKNNFLTSLFFLLQGSYYGRMSLFDQSFESNQKALKLLLQKNDLRSQLLSARCYESIADNYIDMNDLESAHLYINRSMHIVEKISENKYFSTEKIYRDKPIIYFYKSWILLQENKPVEAFPFIEKAYDNAVIEGYQYMALFYEVYGDYYFQTFSYQRAIESYLKAVENKKIFQQYYANVDSKIASSYKELGDEHNMLIYMNRAEKRRQIDGKEDLKFVQKEFDKALAYAKVEKNIEKNDSNLVILGIIIFCILLLIFIFFNIRKKKRENLLEQESRLSAKIDVIYEKEKEIEKLRLKVNESTSELIVLVKENSPSFWIKFQDLYPDFAKKMLKINPALKSTELCFSAYIYLGFSNKEIAEYTFKSVKTIENNRSNLRKRISLSSDEDFTVWIRKYLNEV